MNLTPYWHLVWKEYRAVRGFWLSMIGLVVLLEALVVFSSSEPAWTRLMVYNLALAAPAFFALGCLQPIPISFDTANVILFVRALKFGKHRPDWQSDNFVSCGLRRCTNAHA